MDNKNGRVGVGIVIRDFEGAIIVARSTMKKINGCPRGC
jgi:hypothetical protein